MTASENSGPTFGTAAYGGDNWSPRSAAHRDEMGSLWQGGIDSEWRPLKSVLVHSPGDELNASQSDPDAVQMLAPLDLGRAREEHAALVEAYRAAGVEVHFVQPTGPCPPNQMFCADLFVMTPQGAILARPASTVRAGEEVRIASRLAALEIPILKTMTGQATFEGADLMWLNRHTAIISRGPRTNGEAIEQIEVLLEDLDIDLLSFDIPYGTMHFMGMLRFADHDLAIAWPRRVPHDTVTVLRDHGYQVLFPPLIDDQDSARAINFVTLGPRKILMVSEIPRLQSWFEQAGIECLTTATGELGKAAGNVGCLTGILSREMSG